MISNLFSFLNIDKPVEAIDHEGDDCVIFNHFKGKFYGRFFNREEKKWEAVEYNEEQVKEFEKIKGPYNRGLDAYSNDVMYHAFKEIETIEDYDYLVNAVNDALYDIRNKGKEEPKYEIRNEGKEEPKVKDDESFTVTGKVSISAPPFFSPSHGPSPDALKEENNFKKILKKAIKTIKDKGVNFGIRGGGESEAEKMIKILMEQIKEKSDKFSLTYKQEIELAGNIAGVIALRTGRKLNLSQLKELTNDIYKLINNVQN